MTYHEIVDFEAEVIEFEKRVTAFRKKFDAETSDRNLCGTLHCNCRALERAAKILATNLAQRHGFKE